jgi:hypothetical protein
MDIEKGKGKLLYGVFFIEKQKIVLLPIFNENGWDRKGREAARNTLTI